jgi:hypothetical protein
MGLCLFSEDGYVQDVGSASGWMEVSEFVGKNGGRAIKSFVNKGQTANSRGGLKDIEALLPRAKHRHVKATLQGLKKGFSKIEDKEIAIISQ